MGDLVAVGIIAVSILAAWMFGFMCLFKRQFRLSATRVMTGPKGKVAGVVLVVVPFAAFMALDSGPVGTKAIGVVLSVLIAGGVAFALSRKVAPAPKTG